MVTSNGILIKAMATRSTNTIFTPDLQNSASAFFFKACVLSCVEGSCGKIGHRGRSKRSETGRQANEDRLCFLSLYRVARPRHIFKFYNCLYSPGGMWFWSLQGLPSVCAAPVGVKEEDGDRRYNRLVRVMQIKSWADPVGGRVYTRLENVDECTLRSHGA